MPQNKVISSGSKQPMRPALTPEARENQMISLAIDLAEKQLIEGTASSQVITHFLKLASSKEKKEQEKLELEKKLLEEKTKNLQSSQHQEELYAKAIQAFTRYSGGLNHDNDSTEN